MSLADCPGCWNLFCTCPDGGEWRHQGVDRLLKIRAAIDAALAARVPAADPSLGDSSLDALPSDCGSSNHAPDACGNCEACREVWGLGGPPSVNDLVRWMAPEKDH